MSTFNELCGIAGYTRPLKHHLSRHVDVTVFDLDQYLLRSSHRRVIRLGDRHIAEIASSLKRGGFDCVNIQLEHGTLGRTPAQIMRRFRRLAAAAPALCVTFHTITSGDPVPWAAAWRQVLHGRIGRASAILGDHARGTLLSLGVYRTLRKLQRRKHVSIIVHTKRDMRLLRDVYRLENIEHHPLSFVTQEEAAACRRATTRADFPILAKLPASAKLVGTFGFLSPYKGFETVIHAMHQLPDDYHMLIFGGVHPQTIRFNEPIAPYIEKLIKEAKIGLSVAEQLKLVGGRTTPAGDPFRMIDEPPNSLRGRMHFMGALTDAEFLAAMACCDSVVMPYLEVGQSASGPIANAMEMGCRVIASRTLAFMQYALYHQSEIEFFDIGNHVHLAELLAAEPTKDPRSRKLAFNVTTNVATYMKACGFPIPGTMAPAIAESSPISRTLYRSRLEAAADAGNMP